MKLTLFIIACVIGFLLGLYLIGMIRSISFFFKEKRLSIQEEKEAARVDYSRDLLTLLAQSINLEVKKLMQNYISLNIPYRIEDLDKDVENISTQVYNSIKLDIYRSYGLIFSSGYVMTYIVENTKTILLQEVMEHQKRINLLNTSE